MKCLEKKSYEEWLLRLPFLAIASPTPLLFTEPPLQPSPDNLTRFNTLGFPCMVWPGK